MGMANGHIVCSQTSRGFRRQHITMISSSKILPAVATLLSLCVVVAPGGNGNATLTLCVGENSRNNPGGPYYSGFHGIIKDTITATSSSDRSSSHAFDAAGNYAVAQCRADVSAGECSSCLSACLGTISYTCSSAAVRYDVCLLRYGEGSTEDLSRFDVNEHAVTVFDDGGGKSATTTSLTKEVLTAQLSRLAANASASGSSRTAAGVANYYNPADGGSVYGLAQCITQMKAPDCGWCLRDAVFRLSEDFNSSAGMQVLRPSCMVRYASSPFFNESLFPVTRVSVVPGSDAAPAPAPLPEGSENRRARRSVVSLLTAVWILPLLTAVLTAAVLVTLWCCCIRRSGRKSQSATTGGGNYSYQDLVDATGNFSEENRIGSGGCGIVYKGLLQNNQEIAVKKLARKELKELEREVSLVAELQHENLVKFLGHCYEEGEMFLVYEYLRNKCLSNYFKGSSDRKELDWPIWLNIIKGIACGLNYLHRDSGMDIVHRDLKPSNVLLDSNFTAKIADFDLARGYNRENTHESTRNTAGTYGYMAPECYAEGKFSTKSDVYSYGVMVLEIIVGQSINKFENEKSNGLVEYVWQHWSDLRVGDMLDKGHLGLASHEQMQQAARCVQVALLCVQSDRSRRPAMDEAIHILNGHIVLPDPSAPGYVAAPAGTGHSSVNGVTISVLEPRS